jgi:hypothetical protein
MEFAAQTALANLLLNVVPTRMKSFMIFGSAVGFLIGAGFSLAGGCPWSTALWRACVAALMVAVLTRWWGQVWWRGLQDTLEKRHHSRPLPQVNPKPAAKT